MFEFIGGLNGDDYCPYNECDRYEPGEDGGYSNYYMRPPVRCNICSSTNVYWKQVSGRWILFDKNTNANKSTCHKCHTKRFNKLMGIPVSGSDKIDISWLGAKCIRHPDNNYGYGSPNFWEEEYRLWGCSKEEYFKIMKKQSPKCPICKKPRGFSPGTGDCGCEYYTSTAKDLTIMKFNPNIDIPKKPKPQTIWATYIPNRSPKFKTYSNLGHAKSSLMCKKIYRHGYEFCYILPDECTLWRLVSDGKTHGIWEEVNIIRELRSGESISLKE